LPKNLEVSSLILKPYSINASQKKFLINSFAYLDISRKLIEDSNEVTAINITPPYEWLIDSPRALRSAESARSIRDYARAVEGFVTDKCFKRITVIDDSSALESVINHCWKRYCLYTFKKEEPLEWIWDKNRFQDNPCTSTYTKGFCDWLASLLEFSANLTSRSSDASQSTVNSPSFTSKLSKPAETTANDLLKKIEFLRGFPTDFEKTKNEVYELITGTPATVSNSQNSPSKSSKSLKFERLSLEISKVILELFKGQYHSGDDENSQYLVISDTVLRTTYLELIRDNPGSENILKQEEGFFSSPNRTAQFSLKTEEEGYEAILVTLKQSEREETNYNKISRLASVRSLNSMIDQIKRKVDENENQLGTNP
jgi:hypothetical protein